MRVLVLGATGASGAPVLAALAQRHPQATVTCADVRGTKEVLRCDISDADAVRALLADVAPDHVINLAGTFSNDYALDHAVNVQGTRNLLEAVRAQAPEARVLLVGSAAEYGLVRPEDNPVKESQPLAPVSVYALTKVMQTTLMQFHHRAYGTKVMLARTFNLTGPGLSRALLPGRLEEQIALVREGQAPQITLGALQGQRDFLSLGEAAKAYLRVLDHGTPGEVYNVASGVPTELRAYVLSELAAAGLTESALREGAPAPNQRGFSVWADVSKLRALPV